MDEKEIKKEIEKDEVDGTDLAKGEKATDPQTIRRGRPAKFKEGMLRDARILGALGMTEEQLATYWNVAPETVRRWKRKNPELCGAIEKGKQQANLTVSQELYKSVKNGNMTAIIFWLTNRCPEHWRDRRALVSNKIVSGTITQHINGEPSEIRKMTKKWSAEEKTRFLSIATKFYEDGSNVKEE